MTAPRRMRLDQLLVERGLADSRTRAQSIIMAGLVYAGEKRLEKPGQTLDSATELEVRGPDHPWASRGGLKLDHALDHFAIDVAGKVALDLGASTGGFTDVLLARGAAKVYAVDVGHGQLAWALRQDDRVVVLEKTNARALVATLIPEAPEILVADLSFISLRVALPAALGLAAPGATLVALIKPQFEAGPEKVGKGGVVRDPSVHAIVCSRIRGWLQVEQRWQVQGIVESPVRGADGNREFLIAATKGD